MAIFTKAIFTKYLLLSVVVTTGLSLSGCSDSAQSSKNSLFASIKFWKITDDAVKAYPKLEPHEARRRFAQDKFNEFTATLDPNEKRVFAANFYSGYTQLNARAIPAYCQKMNIDISEFADKFKAINKKAEDSFDTILDAEGITREDIWTRNERFAMAAAKQDLMTAGGHNGTYSLCSKIREKPDRFLKEARFSKHYPTIARTLNTPVRKLALRGTE